MRVVETSGLKLMQFRNPCKTNQKKKKCLKLKILKPNKIIALNRGIERMERRLQRSFGQMERSIESRAGRRGAGRRRVLDDV